MKIAKAIAIICFVFYTIQASAAIKLPGMFGDHMILQRGIKIPVWGWATPGEQLQVTFKDKEYTTIASAEGTWALKLDVADAGGPYDMEIKSPSDIIRIKDILIGDVWLCSGQSNMVFDFNNPRAKALYAQDIASSDTYSQIRQVLVNRDYASHPAANCKTTGWRLASPQTLNSFSAVAYFFARNLYQQYHVPIGIINSSLGGTIAEAWTSEDGLKALPRYAKDIQFLRDSAGVAAKIKSDQDKVADWEKRNLQLDKGFTNGNPTWAATGFDDSQWLSMPKPGFWDNYGFANNAGTFWFRKDVEIPQSAIGKNGTVILGQIDDVDVTWFNGVQIGKGVFRDDKRVYTVPANLIKPGKNTLAIRITNYSGSGGIFPADTLRLKLADTAISLSGSWKFAQGVKLENKPGVLEPKNLPTSLYNAMIAPLEPYALKGVLWYQGEYNAPRAYAYRPLFQALIQDWRAKWGQGNIPFVFEQLPNFQPIYDHPIESDWAELREAQSMALTQPNTAMAVAIDIGEERDIHPVDKKDVGYRLSLAARKLVYGEKRLVASGPIYESMKIEGDKIILHFDTGGSPMVAKGGTDLKFFAIAGADKKFFWAKAIIKGNTIEVSSSQVPAPVAVRYAWAGNPDGCNLFNQAGLPASPFRTDDWPGVTVAN